MLRNILLSSRSISIERLQMKFCLVNVISKSRQCFAKTAKDNDISLNPNTNKLQFQREGQLFVKRGGGLVSTRYQAGDINLMHVLHVTITDTSI